MNSLQDNKTTPPRSFAVQFWIGTGMFVLTIPLSFILPGIAIGLTFIVALFCLLSKDSRGISVGYFSCLGLFLAIAIISCAPINN